MKHKLIIISLDDAKASCACDQWLFMRTGKATKEEIEDEYSKHVPHNKHLKVSEITTEQFDTELQKLVKRDASTLLTIPGIYEIVSELYNNEIIDNLTGQNDYESD